MKWEDRGSLEALLPFLLDLTVEAREAELEGGT